MVTTVCEATGVVITENAPVVWPVANEMLDEANAATAGALLESWTTAGPNGACVRVTTPATVCAPSTVVGGPKVMDCTCDAVVGSTFSGTDPDEFWLGEAVRATTAEMFTVVCTFTAAVVTVNVVMLAPPGITSVGLGSVTTWELSVESMAVKPPAGAAGEKVTVTVAV